MKETALYFKDQLSLEKAMEKFDIKPSVPPTPATAYLGLPVFLDASMKDEWELRAGDGTLIYRGKV